MSWFGRKRRVRSHSTDGVHARKEAQARLAAVDARWGEVSQVAGSLRQLREDNHFAEQISAIFSGRQDK